MKYKIVSDSSSNLYELDEIEYSTVPLKIITNQIEYIDNKELNVEKMLDDLKDYNDKSGTSCPNANEWIEAFGDADIIFAVTITSGLSGSFNAAMMAKSQYEEMNPGKKVYVIDSLSTGPEMKLIIDKLVILMKENRDYKDIRNTIIDYTHKTHLMFSLSSLDNFARNGRISPVLAKSASIFGIRVVGQASYEGKLEPIGFIRGQKKALKKLIQEMKSAGYHGGKVVISHTDNKEGADLLVQLIKEAFVDVDIEMMINGGLCSYYAETGGILVGFKS